MKLNKAYWLTCVLMMACAVVASATTIVVPTDEQLIEKSPIIVEGTVVSSNPINKGNGQIWTEIHLAVSRTLKGNASGEIVIREIGGQLDDRITKVYGSPEYVVGEKVMAFLTPTPRGDYQTMDLFMGKFSEGVAASGRKLWMRDATVENVNLLNANFEPIEARNIQRDATGFETFVANRAAGKAAAANYGLENPVLAGELRSASPTPFQPITANFTLIDEPTIYRWFAFENGNSVRWYSSGTQPGYTGGGINEISSALSAWNTATGAKINYAYSGVMSGAPGGFSTRNNINEILFNDPLAEIPGTWNGSSGIVGQGGFIGVRTGPTWTSTFTADAQHPQKQFTDTWDIAEGSMVIQDNVQPGTGIPSNRLAEILAHEFGHTLGFGHSATSQALMYYTVTGRGPTLGADDITAAQWLYPNGSAPPPPPPPPPATVPVAPSNLAAFAQSTTNGPIINLSWNDNANNELGFNFYVAYNGGAFTKLSASAAAGSTSATLSGLSAGTYQIYIKAYNSAGESTASNTASATVPTFVTAFFTVSQGTGIAGVTNFAFSDQSVGTVTSRLWTFGDGTTSSVTNPFKVYAVPGFYPVRLVVNQGQATESSYTVTLNVTSSSSPQTPSVQAAFDAPTTGLVPGNALTFTDRSTGSPSIWTWSFGDATFSNAQNPTHVYAAPGTYTVSLTVQNSTTSNTTTKTVVISNRNELLLNNSRYRVTINARDQRTGKTATGQATLQTSEFGYFSLPEFTGNANNPEVFVKVLGPVNGVPWVFFGGLTDVEYTLTVTDTQTGAVRTYYHAPGDAKGGYDTGSGQGPAGVCAANTITESTTSLIRATATSEQLAMFNNRFGLTLAARDSRTGKTGTGVTLPMNDESGFFTLPALTGSTTNIEVFVKIVNATTVDGHNWIFFGGLTDFEYTLTVADTQTGKVRKYTKPAGSACGGFDINTF